MYFQSKDRTRKDCKMSKRFEITKIHNWSDNKFKKMKQMKCFLD